MEQDELQSIWTQHEKKLVESTQINKALIKKLLIANAEKRIDWIKIRNLANLILPLILIPIIAIPRIQFTLKFDVVIGIILFISLSVISYIWAVRLYLLIEKLNFDESILSVSKQLKLVAKYKLKITRHGLMLAPFMVIGIFLSAGIPFFSPRMIPFYTLMVVVFLISTYIRTKHGLVAQVRKIDRDMEEIAKLELESNP